MHQSVPQCTGTSITGSIAGCPVTAPDSGNTPARLVSQPTNFAGHVRDDQALPAVFTWEQTGDRSTWVTGIPGRPDDRLVVTQIARARWQPVVEGPARLRGPVMKTRKEAQEWCQRRVTK